jgi:bifunctional non-homologous end joining protein LigD
MASVKDVVEVEGVRLTSPDKVLYPEQGITKRELAAYYLAVAGVMLPHVARRPITLVRCPTGRAKKCFYQRHAGSGVPSELKEVAIEGFDEPYLYLEDARGLVALVQMGVLEMHPWNSHVDEPHKPDQVIFDLDPGEGLAFTDVVAAAHELRAHLDGIGLRSMPKTTGGKGLHLVVPIERRYAWRDVKTFAKAVGDALSKAAPDRYLTKQSIAERRGRIYIDYLRNDPTSTAVAPYSTRSREGAPVSVPLTWDEVVPELDPQAFTVRTVPARVAGLKADPWAETAGLKQGLPQL